MLKKIKKNLSLIGAICLLIITIVNFSSNNNTLTGSVSMVLFVLVLVLFLISRKA